MSEKCFIPGCNNRQTDTIHLFKASNDITLRRWRGAIQTTKTLTSNDNICSTHFEPNLIITECIFEWGDGKIIEKKVAKLTHNATPTIFPEEKRKISLLEISIQFKPLGVNWKTKYDNVRDLFSVYLVAMTKTGIAYVQKQVVVAKDLSYKVYFLRKRMNDEDDCFLESDNAVEDLKYVVNDVDSMRLCSGGPDQREFEGLTPRIAYVDVSGVWRHIKCTVECIKPAFTCAFCLRLNRTLKSYSARDRQRIKKRKRKDDDE